MPGTLLRSEAFAKTYVWNQLVKREKARIVREPSWGWIDRLQALCTLFCTLLTLLFTSCFQTLFSQVS